MENLNRAISYVYPFHRILTVDVEIIFGKDLWSIIDRVTTTVEHSPKHIFGHSQLHGRSGKGDSSRLGVYTRSPFEHLIGERCSRGYATHLDDSLLSANFKHLTTPDSAIRESELNDFVVGRELHWLAVPEPCDNSPRHYRERPVDCSVSCVQHDVGLPVDGRDGTVV